MNKPEIILIGGGGHCKSCIDVIEAENKFDIKGIIDLPSEMGKAILSYSVIGNDDDIPELAQKGYNFLITVGHMGEITLRYKLFNVIKSYGGQLPIIISPTARISKYASIKEGTIIMHNCIINSNADIGKNCIINNKALIEHDTIIGNDCHISTDSNINGNCIVGDDSFIGSGSTLKNGTEIIGGSFIGVGSIVTKSIKIKGLYFGNPAKKIKTL